MVQIYAQNDSLIIVPVRFCVTIWFSLSLSLCLSVAIVITIIQQLLCGATRCVIPTTPTLRFPLAPYTIFNSIVIVLVFA